ncbi:MAG: hypothetical protein H7Z19_06090 [Chitinophagaceae bacterium]|nr:hypothetical protein [Rubrivivax sp.]
MPHAPMALPGDKVRRWGREGMRRQKAAHRERLLLAVTVNSRGRQEADFRGDRTRLQRFNGVLDLTAFTPSVLADHLLRARPQAFRMVRFEQPREFLYHALCLEGGTYVQQLEIPALA